MSTLFKGISKEDLQIEKTKPTLIAPEVITQGMSGPAKFFITLSFIFAASSLAVGVYLYLESRTQKAGWASVEASQIQFRERVQSVEAESSQSNAAIVGLKEQLKSTISENSDLKRDFNNYQLIIANLQKELKDLKDKVFHAEEVLLLETPARGLTEVVTPAAAPEKAEAKEVSSAAAPEKPNAKSSISLEPTVAKTTPQVLTVNRKFKFVVVNMGLKDQTKIGQPLTVERNGKKIGVVAVEKLYDNFSAATIVEESKNAPIQEGDTVRSPS